ncbi:hypothetical protein GOP47_0013442 [Adiantum capillus-veneris]|uniref:Uncharacterized protein n=1 Tax=Adiantum capillus-veneris TaxID=13818 RepID=A0A9D4UP80_ADICA|nr:hypothetical protein GOP47_0013442 [Adiantum capillus-veneris]
MRWRIHQGAQAVYGHARQTKSDSQGMPANNSTCGENYRVTIAKLSLWMSVFGGARSRELVLKERGVDKSVIVGTDLDPSSAPSPIRSSVRTPIEGNGTSSGSLGYGTEKQEKLDERSRQADQHETKMGRQDSGRLERLDSRGRGELADFEKKDERRGSEHRHHHEKQESDRPDVDKQERWRRPVELEGYLSS